MEIDHTNPWQLVSTGADAPETVTGIIEIPQGSRAKYELDKDTGMLKLGRVLFSSLLCITLPIMDLFHRPIAMTVIR